MDLGKKKKSRRIRAKKEDRISNLPDELIHNILSRIPIKQVVQTCILSRRWYWVWSTLPNLNFDRFNFHDGLYRYVNFVENFLSQRNHSFPVSTIRLWLIFFKPGLIKSIVNYAISHNVQEFRIFLANFTVEFPQWSFPVLTTLNLTRCADVPLMSWSLPALTTLLLATVTFQKDQILSFVGFVNLKNLTLQGYMSLHNMEVFVITSRSLVNLTIVQDSVEFRSCSFVVSTPNLSCLEYSGYSPLLLSAEDGFPCLEKVNLDIDVYKNRHKKYFEENKHVIFQQFISLFQEIRGAKFLTLSFNTILVLSRNPDFSEHPPSPFGDLKCLKLDKSQIKPLRRGNPPKSLNFVIGYLLSSSPDATIWIQDWGAFNPKVNMLLWTGSRYLVDISSDVEYTSSRSEGHAADEVDNSGEQMNVHADEVQVMLQDGNENDGGDEETIVQDAIEESVEEDHLRPDPDPAADAVQQKTIMVVTKRIPGEGNTMSNVHVNGTTSRGMNDNLSLWEGHQVYSEFVDLLQHIKGKYPETFEHFDPQNEMIYTVGLNALCTLVSAFFEVTRTNVTTSIITHYRGLFSDLERWGFNTTWLVNYLNSADELCSIDFCIDGAQAEILELQTCLDDAQMKVQELQTRLDDVHTKVKELQALRMVKRAKISEIQEAFRHFKTKLAP